jgi:hypothetical protein
MSKKIPQRHQGGQGTPKHKVLLRVLGAFVVKNYFGPDSFGLGKMV